MRYLIAILILICSQLAFSQVPDILWQKGYGGSSYEGKVNIVQTLSGGYLVVQESNSPVYADKSTVYGGFDIWVLCLDQNGDILWENTYGGVSDELDPYVAADSDGSFYIACNSTSGISGVKESTNYGSYDIWILKIDSLGDIIWQKNMGGNAADEIGDLIATSTGDVLLSSNSSSPVSGNKTVGTNGSYDIWLVKLDSGGNEIWQSGAGTSSVDAMYGNAALERPNGNYMICTSTSGGISGDKTLASKGSNDFWMIEFDTSGALVWQNVVGGSAYDGGGIVINTDDDGFLISGLSYSDISGDKTENSRGLDDMWLVKCASDGSIEWDKTIGGATSDNASGNVVQWPDGSFVILGLSQSFISGDKTEASYGSFDYWMVRIDSARNILWQKTYGGIGGEYYATFLSLDDYSILIAGMSQSGISGNKTVSLSGASDMWLIQLEPDSICSDTEITIDSVLYDTTLTLIDGTVADTSGTYVVVLSGDGCDSIITYNLEFYFTPVVNFTYAADLTELTFTDLSENDPTSWKWFFGDGTTSTEQNPVHTYATAGSYGVCLKATNDAGTAFDCAWIEVNAAGAPVADYTFETVEDSTYFTDMSSPEATSWLWFFGDGTTSSEQNPVHAYASSGSYAVCLLAGNDDGSSYYCDIIQICVPVTITISGDSAICSPGSTTIISDLDEATAFMWRKDGLPYPSAGATYNMIEVDEPGSYALTYIDPEGCTGTTNPVTVALSDPPEVTLILPDDQFCKFDGLIALSGGLPAGGIYSGPGISGGNLNTGSLAAGTYELTYSYINEAGCSATATDTFYISNNPPASATLGSASNNLCVNDPVVFFANSGAGYTYQWYRNNTLLPGETALAYLASTPGNYQVEVTNAEGCSRLSAKKKVVSSGCRMAEIEGAELLLYPNPADDVVHYLISFTGQTGQSCDIRLRDLTGRLLLERFELITGQQISGFIALDLPAGWYTISVQTENGYLLTNPLIIE